MFQTYCSASWLSLLCPPPPYSYSYLGPTYLLISKQAGSAKKIAQLPILCSWLDPYLDWQKLFQIRSPAAGKQEICLLFFYKKLDIYVINSNDGESSGVNGTKCGNSMRRGNTIIQYYIIQRKVQLCESPFLHNWTYVELCNWIIVFL